MERAEAEEVSDLKQVSQLAMPLWNYSLGIERGEKKEEMRALLMSSFQEVLLGFGPSLSRSYYALG